MKTKAVRERLGDGLMLPSVEEAQTALAARMTPAIRRHIAESRERFARRSGLLGEAKEEMTRMHRVERLELERRQRDERHAEATVRAAKLPRGLAALWHRMTGAYRAMRAVAEAEAAATRARQSRERDVLVDRQRGTRAGLQAEFKDLRRGQAEQLLVLRRDVGRFLALSKGRGPDAARETSRGPTPERTSQPGPARGLGLGLER